MLRLRRLLPAFCLALLALGSTAGVAAAAEDEAAGAGTVDQGQPTNFTFDAGSDANGANAFGTANVVLHGLTDVTESGPVTCLNVSGNRAVVGFENTNPQVSATIPYVYLRVQDTQNGRDRILIDQQYSMPANPAVCPSPWLAYITLSSGAINVIDTP